MSGFDSLGYAQKLRAVGVPFEQAETEAALIRDEVVSLAATKADLLAAEQRLNDKIDRVEERLKSEIALSRSEMTQVGQRVTITLGSMMAGAVVLIVTAQQLFGP
jgi:uncharacterized protein YlxW (UPF0749 family)